LVWVIVVAARARAIVCASDRIRSGLIPVIFAAASGV
jgi:hypothetical protein